MLATALAAAPPASANDFQNVYREFKRTGTIKACHFSDNQLRNAARQTPPDVEQYAPSFLDALQSAREHSAGCNKKPAAAVPAPAPATPTPTATQPAPAPAPTAPQPVQAQPTPAPTVPAQPSVANVASPPVQHPTKKDSAPSAVWLLAVLAALAALAAIWAALSWWFGWSTDRWTKPIRASTEDFAERFSDIRLEFMEWIRSGT